MITWDSFTVFAIPTLALWLLGSIFALAGNKKKIASLFTLAGIMVFSVFVIMLWISLERPPMRTMGETRLWYSLFLAGVGLILYQTWKHNWILVFNLVVAAVFVIINLLKPDIHSKNLMPALQSIWFIPHVVSYILSYSFLSAATVAAIRMLVAYNKKETIGQYLHLTDNLIYIGFGLLMAGLLIGALWAKEAWGHYWSWDPKETWALITAAGYLIYIHLRLREKMPKKITLWMIVISFVFLMITWKGVEYLPAAKDSVHTYAS
jgi:ABC-type transport system involved in cytochrome c biogenesis permease subunit